VARFSVLKSPLLAILDMLRETTTKVFGLETPCDAHRTPTNDRDRDGLHRVRVST
jgi:hypothetical protein